MFDAYNKAKLTIAPKRHNTILDICYFQNFANYKI